MWRVQWCKEHLLAFLNLTQTILKTTLFKLNGNSTLKERKHKKYAVYKGRLWQKKVPTMKEWISLAVYLRLLFNISLTTRCRTNIWLILIPRLAAKTIRLILRHDIHEFVWNKPTRNELWAEYPPEPFWDFYNEFITDIISFLLLLFLGCSISINSIFQCLVSPLLFT